MSDARRPNLVAVRSEGPPESESLRKLREGEITVGAYLDYHADRAVEHLQGLIDSERLQFIRSMLREQMTTDPVLIEYLKRATGIDLGPFQGS